MRTHERRVEGHLVEGLASCDHRGAVFRLGDPRLEHDRLVVVVLHELLHLGGKVGRRVAVDRVHAHRLGESDKVGVRHGRVRVSLLVEEV